MTQRETFTEDSGDATIETYGWQMLEILIKPIGKPPRSYGVRVLAVKDGRRAYLRGVGYTVLEALQDALESTVR